ncbi:hypothetical protein [Streptomyces prunicolor]|uniref:hypothetical protein n=1 Tax=Streptomyces prunicolor TaxID=67348 RepID=UPI0003624D51|nr:hypothetical protein [Streptomyces prunicolor]
MGAGADAEEDLDCTEQTQRPGERLTGLQSLSFARGEGGNTSGDDLLLETGQRVSDTHGGPYPYWLTLRPLEIP